MILFLSVKKKKGNANQVLSRIITIVLHNERVYYNTKKKTINSRLLFIFIHKELFFWVPALIYSKSH